MKKGIHPEYVEARATCSCGETFVTRSTKSTLRVEICSKCHPFFTGKQKLVDTGGRVQRFQKRYGLKAKPKAKSKIPKEESAKKESPKKESSKEETSKTS